ncbi:carcinine hydrolase/isopenicillin-N N-acyltransferase family protein [Ornatilinea apprima]|uniref:carcinine hydrolase/isopenicillin-N N-acyltransferase family protein n=1 Tax=Ornatilinea apprima TaxID=1134406 RepID=UPI000946423D|nr:carcinine hydrolase/isopenicillin-N N-acyltransferase family protein [Ornatilinea apprima]
MCTTFICESGDQFFLANNEDIFLPSGMLFTNQRGIHKTALLMPPEVPLQWLSCYGSVVFSQSGKEFPSGGMNEVGLIVEQTTLRETQYPSLDSRPAVKELQVIQFLLDTCETVPQALKSLAEVRISQTTSTIQYILLDRKGNSAIVEYLNGHMQVFEDDCMPVPVLTNTIYTEALNFLNSNGNKLPAFLDEYAKNSVERFCVTASLLEQMDNGSKPQVSDLYKILDAAQRPDTIWKIIYDPISLTIHIKTQWDRSEKWINLTEFDFSDKAASFSFDLQQHIDGNLRSHFTEYSTDINRQLIYSFFHHEMIRQVLKIELPDDLLEYLASYPMQMGIA